jgi:hypothetical protein
MIHLILLEDALEIGAVKGQKAVEPHLRGTFLHEKGEQR